jgi:hypothetical protein
LTILPVQLIGNFAQGMKNASFGAPYSARDSISRRRCGRARNVGRRRSGAIVRNDHTDDFLVSPLARRRRAGSKQLTASGSTIAV